MTKETEEKLNKTEKILRKMEYEKAMEELENMGEKYRPSRWKMAKDAMYYLSIFFFASVLAQLLVGCGESDEFTCDDSNECGEYLCGMIYHSPVKARSVMVGYTREMLYEIPSHWDSETGRFEWSEEQRRTWRHHDMILEGYLTQSVQFICESEYVLVDIDQEIF